MGRPVLFMFLVTASFTDLRARYVDNLQNLFFIILGLIFAFLERGISGVADGILSALMVFVLLYVFYAGGFLGAGDIKFIMAAAVYTGHEVLVKAMAPVAIFSLILMVLMQIREKRLKGLKVPMALPVSLGIIAAFT